MYPIRRKRRLRKSAALRDLVQETHIHPDDFIVPLFVVEGKGVKEEIPSMMLPQSAPNNTWASFKRYFTNPVTWKSPVYLLMKFPFLGIVF